MSRALVLLLALAASGCTSELTRAGAGVRLVTSEATARCTRLGPVEGAGANGASVADDARAATHDVRNRVAKRGGNAYAVTGQTSGPWRTVVQADAYRCPDWEPVPGLAPAGPAQGGRGP